MHLHWLSPPPVPATDLPDYTVGRHLSEFTAGGVRAVLLGVDAGLANGVRDHLYRMAWDFEALKLADLGNLRKQTVDFAVPLFRELYASGILPIIIGGRGRLLAAQYLAFAELNRQVGLCHVDGRIQLHAHPPEQSREVLDRAVHRSDRPAFHLAHLGSQRHLVDPALDGLFLSRHYERVSLGQGRSELAELEPAIRDADVFALDLGAVLAAEAPAQSGQYPSGFSLQEAGQLTYYAGNSDRLTSFGIYGYDAADCTERECRRTQAAQAQLVWYFLHGLSRRAGDFPVTTAGLVEYVVDSRVTDRLTFWRSPRSNRWWVQVPVEQPDGEERNRLVACSYGDYLQVSQRGELPERLHLAFSRY